MKSERETNHKRVSIIGNNVWLGDWMAAGDAGCERIHPRQNKKVRSLLDTLQGGFRQDDKGGTATRQWQRGYTYRAE